MATATWKHYAMGEKWRTKIMLHGMTDKPAADLVPLANSWLQPPELKISGRNYNNKGYDPTQLAHVLTSNNPGKGSELSFELAASKDSPVINPAFVVKCWGEADVALKIDGKTIKRGKNFRIGYERTDKGTNLIVWIKTESNKPIKISLTPINN